MKDASLIGWLITLILSIIVLVKFFGIASNLEKVVGYQKAILDELRKQATTKNNPS